MNRGDFQVLARIRLSEAKSLLNAGFPDGAFYLADYSVECGLKACIAKGTRLYDFPDKKTVEASHTHNLKDLVRVANLEAARLEQAREDPAFLDNWDLVQQWSEQDRYRRHETVAATALVDAVGSVKHGVIVMDKTALVTSDLAAGARILEILDHSGLEIEVAMWLHTPEYGDWRLVLSSRRLDSAGPSKAYGLVHNALGQADFPLEHTPPLFVLKMTDPFVQT